MSWHDERYEDGEPISRASDYEAAWDLEDLAYEAQREEDFARDAYELTDPKHPDYLQTMADLADNDHWSVSANRG